MKNGYKIKKYIDENINEGDRVLLIDGSGLTCDNSDESIYIVCSYKELTGSSLNLKDLVGTIKEINVDDYVCNSCSNTVYLQDIVVTIGDSDFRTCSQFLKKV